MAHPGFESSRPEKSNDRQDARLAYLFAQAGDRGRNRGRMMREIVEHGNPVDGAAHLHPPLDVLKTGQRGDRLRWRHADMTGGGLSPEPLALRPGKQRMRAAM